MGNVFPLRDLTVEPLIEIRLRSPRRNRTTYPFDPVQIRRCLGPERLDAQRVPIPLAFPNIREPSRGVRDGVAQRHPRWVV